MSNRRIKVRPFRTTGNTDLMTRDPPSPSSTTGTWSFEPRSRQLTLSAQARHLLGIPADQTIALQSFLALLEPSVRERMAKALRIALEVGAPFDLECRIAMSSGDHRWLRLLGTLLRAPDGTPDRLGGFAPDRLGGFVLDIDNNKTLEDALHIREEHFRSILDTVPDAMTVIDERGIIQFFSRAAERQFGFTANEAIGKNISTLMPEPDRGRHDGYISRYLKTGERHIIGIGRIVTGLRRARRHDLSTASDHRRDEFVGPALFHWLHARPH